MTTAPRTTAGALILLFLTFLIAASEGPDVGFAADRLEPTEHVIVIGAAGLRWSDIDEQNTPALWKLTGAGSAASMSVRAAGRITCPDDGWVTLGAGNRARGLVRLGQDSPEGRCSDELGIT
ncbi:MAG: hypothetical protein ACRDPW_00540, partial [Mycobacteriales bacterium]